MTRLGAAFWLGLVLASGFATFKVKYAVQDIDDRLTRVRQQTVADRREIRVLTAEWAYLNQPQRLADLNRRFLQLAPVSPKQLEQRVADIPLRAPVAAPAPEMLVAATRAPQGPMLPIVRAAFRAEAVRPALAVALAKAAGPVPAAAAATPHSLDALFAQIAEAR